MQHYMAARLSHQRVDSDSIWRLTLRNLVLIAQRSLIYSVLNDIKNGETEKYDNAQLYIDNAGLVLNKLLSEIGVKGKVVEISLSMDGIGN